MALLVSWNCSLFSHHFPVYPTNPDSPEYLNSSRHHQQVNNLAIQSRINTPANLTLSPTLARHLTQRVSPPSPARPESIHTVEYSVATDPRSEHHYVPFTTIVT